jgi:pSer/pThr/pTyr-binding forkhead associated (FHA) protein
MDALEIGTGTSTHLVPLPGQRLSIGRAQENDVVLSNDSTVSRRHAMLERVDSGWRIRDLGSSNGTFVNGVRVGAHMRVNRGDRITVGDAVLVVKQEQTVADPILQTMRPTPEQQTGPIITQRERAVLRLLAVGSTDAQIAEQLMISVKTVHSHLDRIREKTGVRRRAELTRFAVDVGLMDA